MPDCLQDLADYRLNLPFCFGTVDARYFLLCRCSQRVETQDDHEAMQPTTRVEVDAAPATTVIYSEERQAHVDCYYWHVVSTTSW